jgi:hypothetical protein
MKKGAQVICCPEGQQEKENKIKRIKYACLPFTGKGETAMDTFYPERQGIMFLEALRVRI